MNYAIKEINGRNYELRPTKYDKNEIGLVPVVVVKTLEDIGDLLATGAMTESAIVSVFISGLAVDLQAKARNAMSTGRKGPTEVEKAGIYKKLCLENPDFIKQHVGDYAALTAEINRYWRENYTDGKTAVTGDKNKVWNELAFVAPK
jgi:hypothetical protein